MPLQIIREDITRMKVDAIVTAGSAEPGTPSPTGGVNGSIHRAAGSGLLAALRRLGGVPTGATTLTAGYDLPSRYVIHTAGPIWQGGGQGEEALLRSCYRQSLLLAERKGLRSIAFPLISAGTYGYPRAEALRVAVEEIRAFLSHSDMNVWLVVFDRESFRLGEGMFHGVEQYVDQHYVDEHLLLRMNRPYPLEQAAMQQRACAAPVMAQEAVDSAPVPGELARRLERLDEGFSQSLLRLIDEKGMTDPECYRRANVDRKLFSKLRSNPAYRPKKPTAAALCIALELGLEETRAMLAKAGYGMSRASRFDVILEYFITSGIYDVDEINLALWHYDQPLLGSAEKTP